MLKSRLLRMSGGAAQRARSVAGFTLIEILVVITIIASLAGAVMVLVPRIQEKQRQTTCAGRLSQFGALYQGEQMERGGGRPTHNGVGYFLNFRTGKGRLIAKGQEEVFTCPGDPVIIVPNTPELQAKYDEVDLRDPDDSLCSFMVRDFRAYPLDRESPDLEILAADRQGTDHMTAHHKGGINILYEDGSVKFKDRDELGISEAENIVVGENASNEMLRKLIYGEPQKD